MSNTPPPNPNADKAREAMREYAGLPVVHISQHAPTKREPISAALLAQSVSVEPGMFCEWTDDKTIADAQPMTDAKIVTWRGRRAAHDGQGRDMPEVQQEDQRIRAEGAGTMSALDDILQHDSSTPDILAWVRLVNPARAELAALRAANAAQADALTHWADLWAHICTVTVCADYLPSEQNFDAMIAAQAQAIEHARPFIEYAAWHDCRCMSHETAEQAQTWLTANPTTAEQAQP
jgi:hypothetical protein